MTSKFLIEYFCFSKFIPIFGLFAMDDFGYCEEPTSRAFWGSEDPEEDSTTGPTFTLEWLTDSPSSIKTLVIVAGNIVTGIIDKCITHNAERICTVNSTAEFNVAALYKLSNDIYVCTVTGSIDVTSAGKLIIAISEITSRSEKIIAFTDEIISRLNGAERDNVDGPTLWRSLSTRKGRDERLSKVPSLKHPNFIVGVAAGVIGYAEMMDIPATLYILYVAEDAYDTETIEPMMKLFAEVTNCPMPKIDSSAKTFNSNKLKLYI